MFIEHSVNFCALSSIWIFKKLHKHVDQKNTFCKCTVQTSFFLYRNLSFTDSCLRVFVWGWRLIVDPVTCLPFEICYVHCYFMWLQLLAFEYLNQILFHEFNLDHNIISEDAFKIAFSGLMKADISSPQCAGSVCLLCLQKACKKAEHRQPLPEFSWYIQSFEMA